MNRLSQLYAYRYWVVALTTLCLLSGCLLLCLTGSAPYNNPSQLNAAPALADNTSTANDPPCHRSTLTETAATPQSSGAELTCQGCDSAPDQAGSVQLQLLELVGACLLITQISPAAATPALHRTAYTHHPPPVRLHLYHTVLLI